MDAERPEGILAKTPGNGMGKGNKGDTEASMPRCKCKVECRNFEKGDLVLKTEIAKNEHHLLKSRVSTADAHAKRSKGL